MEFYHRRNQLFFYVTMEKYIIIIHHYIIIMDVDGLHQHCIVQETLISTSKPEIAIDCSLDHARRQSPTAQERLLV